MFRFIDREEELGLLNEKYRKGGLNFIPIYGRRRVGKTELAKQFLKGKPYIYFLADKRGTEQNLERFKVYIAEFFNEPVVSLDTFDKMFAYIAKKAGKSKIVIVIDEFSYMVEKDSSIPSVFQIILDEAIAGTNIFLLLSGSSVSMMEKGVLSSKSPLYGRRTGQIRVEPLRFKDAAKFLPKYSLRDCIEAYSVTGGIPFYLQKFTDAVNVPKNIQNAVLRKGEVLYEEVDFLLKEELREPAVYKSVLEGISSGCSKSSEIANKARINAKDIDKYLKVLIRLGFIGKFSPVTGKPKSKKTIYGITDNFFNFWFTFCQPNISILELGQADKAMDFISIGFNSYVGRAFENVCREFLSMRHISPFDFEKSGRWWAGEQEIDIVALNSLKRQILFAECKWQDNIDAAEVLKALKDKAKAVDWRSNGREEFYAIFARSFKKQVNEKNVLLFGIKDMAKGFGL
ncbi:MAG: ATP-binding protein [Nanoarchaeota archaeon]|nr:ATP-binding protein [Nanoarchaeota archaeon]